MFRLLGKKKVAPMNVVPGDTIILRYSSAAGRRETFVQPIDQVATYDTLAVGKIEDELGFKDGLVGIIGNE